MVSRGQLSSTSFFVLERLSGEESSRFDEWEKMGLYIVKKSEAHKEENHMTIRSEIWSSLCVSDTG